MAWAGVVWNASSQSLAVLEGLQIKIDRVEQSLDAHNRLPAHNGAAVRLERVDSNMGGINRRLERIERYLEQLTQRKHRLADEN